MPFLWQRNIWLVEKPTQASLGFGKAEREPFGVFVSHKQYKEFYFKKKIE